MGAPYQVPDANFGWSARDACYSFGSYDLAEDEALVITHRPPGCRFWSMVVWNQFMATHSAGDGRTSVNIGSAEPNRDGTVTIVVSHGPSAHPNAADHDGLPARQPRVPLVPRRRGTRPARRAAGEARGRTDSAQLRRQTMSGALTRASSASWSVGIVWLCRSASTRRR